uniref:Uncharacterized protein n=1 Tax=Arundo donax TaxID=35708 RepID=A0A0A9CRX9_ARUDO
MPAASPRRQASPVDMTLTSARTTRRRRTLASLGSRHGHLGSSCGDAVEKAAAAKETVVRDMEAVAGSEIEHCRGPSSGLQRRRGSGRRSGRWQLGGGRVLVSFRRASCDFEMRPR